MKRTLLSLLALGMISWAPASAEPGSGYRPGGSLLCHRAIPGGPPVSSAANWSAPDPWALACVGTADETRCLRYEGFLDFSRDGVAEAYQARYGFSWRELLGGWCTKSSEAASRVGEALEWFCLNNPARIGSGGLANGRDCIPTAREVTDSLANGEAARIAAEFCLATEGTADCEPAPVVDPPDPRGTCEAPKVCMVPPLPCKTCPPPVEIPDALFATLDEACAKWVPVHRPQRRKLCANALHSLRTALGGAL